MKYYFCLDEPIKIDGKVLCAFHISNIKRNRAFFFIVERKRKIYLLYSLIDSKMFYNLLLKFRKNETDTIEGIIENNPIYIREYNKLFLKEIEIKDKEKDYVIETINKMNKDNIYNACNETQGLDGFSLELKLSKEDELCFYSWAFMTDYRYYYIGDFVNKILDMTEIDGRYRFKK